MEDSVSQLLATLLETVLPNLKSIQTRQAEQRLQTEQLNQNLEEFRVEMLARFDELQAELAASHARIETAVIALREVQAAQAALTHGMGKHTLIH
jgi:DNA repair exonuclease SbcCD ATPase subunit